MAFDTSIIKEGARVHDRLALISLDHKRLAAVGSAAMFGRSQASALHPANAAGIFAYHDGVEALRAEFLGRDGWRKYAKGGLEGIYHDEHRLIILFKNVHRCCSDAETPQAAPVGVNSEKICENATLFDHVGVDLPSVGYILDPGSFGVKTSRISVFYLMIDQDGRLELSMPVFKEKAIEYCVERIYIVEDADLDRLDDLAEDAAQDDDDFVIEVKRKNEM